MRQNFITSIYKQTICSIKVIYFLQFSFLSCLSRLEKYFPAINYISPTDPEENTLLKSTWNSKDKEIPRVIVKSYGKSQVEKEDFHPVPAEWELFH